MIRRALTAAVLLLPPATARADDPPPFEWKSAEPEAHGIRSADLDAIWSDLERRQTVALVIVHRDRLIFERYGPDRDRHWTHSTASTAKALVGGLGLMLAMDDGRLQPDDPAGRWIPGWADDPSHRSITIRHLATHTSGIEDAEEGGKPHDRLEGWKGDFWKRLPPPLDPFTTARDRAPVLDEPGRRFRYSNPGMAMLAYALTAGLREGPDGDLRALLKHRILEPIGVPEREWSIGYGTTTEVDRLPLVATWGGGAYSADAVARVGRLMLRKGDWEGRQLLSARVVEAALKPGTVPGHSGLGWWVNGGRYGKIWGSAPEDAFGGAGAGQQLLFVVPSLDLIIVRNGQDLDPSLAFEAGLDRHVIGPIVKAIGAGRKGP
ncbi:MAG: serine hydrolase domain-containing protein [Isosphaeraceae bacterium]